MVRFIKIMPLLMKHNPMESVIVIDNRFTYFSYQAISVSYIAMVSLIKGAIVTGVCIIFCIKYPEMDIINFTTFKPTRFALLFTFMVIRVHFSQSLIVEDP